MGAHRNLCRGGGQREVIEGWAGILMRSPPKSALQAKNFLDMLGAKILKSDANIFPRFGALLGTAPRATALLARP